MDTELLTVSQTAQYLQLSEKTIRRMIGNGNLPASKLGNRTWRIRACDVDEYVSNSRQNKPTFSKAELPELELETPEHPRLISLFSGCGGMDLGFKKAGFDRVFDKDRIAIVLDHFVPNKDIKAAEQSKTCREFACSHCVSHFYDVGKMGIEHALLPEQGVVTAGDCIIGADSHTCTYGALGAFSTGVGSTDMAAGMATGMAWFKVPSAIRFNLTGKLPANCSGKDVILTIIGRIGVDGALYKSMEFVGEGVQSLSMDDRLCICNMAIEAGAKNGIFPVDEQTIAYMDGRCERTPVVFEADADAEYEKTYDIDLCAIVPTVACPHLPENTRNLHTEKCEKPLTRGVGYGKIKADAAQTVPRNRP